MSGAGNILVPGPDVEALGGKVPPDVPLTWTEQEAVAKLCSLITQAEQRRAGSLVVHPKWEELTPSQRARMRLGVARVWQALVMLGFIEQPEGGT